LPSTQVTELITVSQFLDTCVSFFLILANDFYFDWSDLRRDLFYVADSNELIGLPPLLHLFKLVAHCLVFRFDVLTNFSEVGWRTNVVFIF